MMKIDSFVRRYLSDLSIHILFVEFRRPKNYVLVPIPYVRVHVQAIFFYHLHPYRYMYIVTKIRCRDCLRGKLTLYGYACR